MRYLVFAYASILSMLFAGSISAVELKACKENDPVPKGEKGEVLVWLRSNEGKCVELKQAVALQSTMIKDMVTDLGGHLDIPLPLTNLDNRALKDIATMLDETFGKTHDVIKSELENFRKGKPTRTLDLTQLILNANYLGIEPLLPAALDAFTKEVFENDLSRLGNWNESYYRTYKKTFLDSLPGDLQRLIIKRRLFPALGLLMVPPANVAVLNSPAQRGAFSPHGNKIVTVGRLGIGNQNVFNIYDSKVVGQAKPLKTFKTDGGWAGHRLAMSADEKLIATTNFKQVELWETIPSGTLLKSHKRRATLKVEAADIVFSSDGNYILIASTHDKTATLWDANATGENVQPLATLKHANLVFSVAFSHDGKYILVGCDDETILWDANSRGDNAIRLATLKDKPARHHRVAFGPDDTYILTAGGHENAKLWKNTVRGDNAQPYLSLKPKGVYVQDAAFRQNGNILTVSSTQNSPGSMDLWAVRLPGNQTVPDITWHIKWDEGFVFNRDGNSFLKSANDKLLLWVFLDENQMSLAALQAILYAYKNNLTALTLPRHLQDEINKAYLSQK